MFLSLLPGSRKDFLPQECTKFENHCFNALQSQCILLTSGYNISPRKHTPQSGMCTCTKYLTEDGVMCRRLIGLAYRFSNRKHHSATTVDEMCLQLAP